MIAKYPTAALLGTALLAGVAMAQTSTTTTSKVDNAAAPATNHRGQWRSSKLKGVNVYNETNEKLGGIKDLIINQNGNVERVIINVGGFLEMGEHRIAVSFDKLKWVNEPVKATAAKDAPSSPMTKTPTTTTTAGLTRSANERWYPDHAILIATKDQLKAMTQFKY